MRFVSRILLGVTAATLVAIGAPVAANATTTSATSATTSYDADWGPYYSSDHKAKAYGHVSVEKKKFKHWYWKWVPVQKKKVCWKDSDGDKHCKWVVKKVKKHVWEWRYDHFFTVHSTLHDKKWWGKNKCAWEKFKVVHEDGSTYFKSFYNCKKFPAHFSFHGKNVAHIYVDVSRGNKFHSTGYNSGWQDVYHAAA
ncbi:hypothetical protein [Nonomuraea basaltis]|uniref:hypothetical protein n=1 Tax=Nonomuraea basaltis TaxID=2495887 RepID=UPI00110C5860|nr:hypothetical protein [Nonomuraea basaltis]TMR91762.1 hypothetical protein EJK15_48265 [Nonomuraea basaltis]